MDTSKTFVKMCEQAKEIQTQKPFDRMSWYYLPMADDVYEGGLLNTVTTAIWLPEQDQLQKMYGDYDDCLTAMYWWKEASRIGDYYGYDDFASMEQLWLAIVMEKLYNKVWNGSKWDIFPYESIRNEQGGDMKEQLAQRLAGGELGGRGLGTKNYFLAQAQIAIDYFCAELEKQHKYHRFGFEDGTLLVYKEDWQALKTKILEGK